MDDRISMSISDDSPSDETLNRGPLALLLRRQYEFPFGINIVQFSCSCFMFMFHVHVHFMFHVHVFRLGENMFQSLD